MKTSIKDLNEHLFAQLERLNDESTAPENMKQEIEKAKAMSNVARVISDNMKLVLEAHKLTDDGFVKNLPKMLEG